MGDERRVRRLELTAPDERLVRRGALLVEDALATASLPVPQPGRLLLIRSLDLGRIRAGESPASVALRLEARLRDAGASAVWAGDPRAFSAGAVWFRDLAEAIVLLARRLVRRQEAAAWFWRRAVPAWRADLEVPRALRALLFTALESPAGLVAAVELVRALLEEDALEPLAAGLTPSDGPLLLRASGWRTAPGLRPAEAMAPEEVAAPVLRRVRRWGQRWGIRDARAVWATAVLLLVERPARLADLRLPARAVRVLEAVSGARGLGVERTVDVEAAARHRGEPSPPAPLPPLLPPAPGEGRHRPPKTKGWSMNEGDDPELTAAEEHRRRVATAATTTPPQRAPAERVAYGLDGEPTSYAGLFFLLPVLGRLGIAGFLDVHPHFADQALAARILDRLARRLGAAADEPVRQVLEVPASRVGDWSFQAPERWLSLQPPQAGRNRAPVDWWRPSPGEGGRGGGRGDGGEGLLLLDAWLTAARRWCRRSARIGLASLVRRPGLVAATRTHLDVTFELRRADIRIRRAGLDLDPGWLPWLGRVVCFHFERLEVGDERRR